VLRRFALAGTRSVIVVVLACACAIFVSSASARGRVPVAHVNSVRCWPGKACGGHPHVVTVGGTLRLRGRHLKPGMVVLFRGRSKVHLSARRVPRLRRSKAGLVISVPSWARSGRIRVVGSRGRRSNAAGPITVARPHRRPDVSGVGPFDGTGIWIWYVSRSSGGDPAAILAQARDHGVRTVFVKSSDGTGWWSQFSPALVSALKSAGLRVCAWQFAYGSRPSTEAALGIRAAQTGADCLVIDAESSYEGKYAQAQTYLSALRAGLGVRYPLALAGFPYVDYHPAFPYSVFFGADGAQANLPQVYWKAIGTSVDQAIAHTYMWNGIYGRPIFPLGQLYDDPSPRDILRFRELARAHGSTGLSWWSWQSASARGWASIVEPLEQVSEPPATLTYPTLKRGARGDAVVWAQEHLIASGESLSPNGVYSSTMEQAVRAFQTVRALPTTGEIDAATWSLLLQYEPITPDWTKVARASTTRDARTGPRSARLRGRNELRGAR
jgi:Putative peptidoglycan binding domain